MPSNGNAANVFPRTNGTNGSSAGQTASLVSLSANGTTQPQAVKASRPFDFSAPPGYPAGSLFFATLRHAGGALFACYLREAAPAVLRCPGSESLPAGLWDVVVSAYRTPRPGAAARLCPMPMPGPGIVGAVAALNLSDFSVWMAQFEYAVTPAGRALIGVQEGGRSASAASEEASALEGGGRGIWVPAQTDEALADRYPFASPQTIHHFKDGARGMRHYFLPFPDGAGGGAARGRPWTARAVAGCLEGRGVVLVGDSRGSRRWPRRSDLFTTPRTRYLSGSTPTRTWGLLRSPKSPSGPK
jgi:hypothetical protein